MINLYTWVVKGKLGVLEHPQFNKRENPSKIFFWVMSPTISKDQYSMIEQSNTLIQQLSIPIGQLNILL